MADAENEKTREELIAEALGTLDPLNDGHWNQSGAAQLDILNEALPETAERITRKELVAFAPSFNRDAAAAIKDKENYVKDDETGAYIPPEDDKTEKQRKEGIERFDEQIASYRDIILNAQAQQEALRQDIENARKAIDRLTDERNLRYPPLTPAANIQQYLASQKKQREDRFKAAGVFSNPKSPLDQAMARGNRRPVVGVQVK